MISNTGIPPYNRFDKIPQHALQVGISTNSRDQFYTSPPTHTTLANKQQYTTGCYHTAKFNSAGSRNSVASTISTTSSEKSSSGTTSHDFEGGDLHARSPCTEKCAPPLHSRKHNVPEEDSKRRAQLPKKSPAAQKCAAELLKSEKSTLGNCFGCKKLINKVEEACQAMGQNYHNSCFTCNSCGRSLREKPFYAVEGRVYCEEDYMYSGFQQNIDKCHKCGHLIMDMILQALGRSFHPGCFRCTECSMGLDGVPFTIDLNENVYCIDDYHRRFAPKCAACGNIIIPINGSDETVRVVALDKDYHVDCYHCEKCKTQLTDESDKRCYPIGDHLLCYGCHIEIRSASLPSPSASSTSSEHSSSYSIHGRSSPALQNGHMTRKPVSHNTIPKEVVPSTRSSKGYSKLHNDTSSWKMNSQSHNSSPNQRLHEKVMQHMASNKDFKLKSMPNYCDTVKRLSQTLPEAPRFKSVVTHAPKPPTLSHTTREFKQYPVNPSPSVQPQRPKSSSPVEAEGQLIAPRSVPVDHAVPQTSLRRMQGTRRRSIPFTDMIMQKKIAESLQKSLSNARKSTSPSSPTENRRSPSPMPHTARHSLSATTKSHSPYMPMWQAREMAASVNKLPVAVAQEPVQSQELPPRLVSRREPKPSESPDAESSDKPPGRPPRFKFLHVTKI